MRVSRDVRASSTMRSKWLRTNGSTRAAASNASSVDSTAGNTSSARLEWTSIHIEITAIPTLLPTHLHVVNDGMIGAQHDGGMVGDEPDVHFRGQARYLVHSILPRGMA